MKIPQMGHYQEVPKGGPYDPTEIVKSKKSILEEIISERNFWKRQRLKRIVKLYDYMLADPKLQLTREYISKKLKISSVKSIDYLNFMHLELRGY